MVDQADGQDATDEDRRDELDRLREELHKAGEARDAFFAILAHELRNHIQTIGTNALLVKARSREPDIVRPAEAIERQVARMSKMLSDLLDVVRATSPAGLQLEPIPLQRVVSAAVSSVTSADDAHRRELTVDMAPEPLYVKADPERLQQAIAHLVRNAIRHSPQQGAVTVLVSEEENAAVVSVRDQGSGIAAEELPRLFRLDRERSAAKRGGTGGLGIGLHVAREVLRAHGGSIEARSAGAGKGSQFVARVPLTRERPREEDRAAPQDGLAEGKPLSILVVDDNRDSADSLAEVLQVYGHEVRVAYGGEEALEESRKGGVQVALVDIGMPTVDGFEVARRISRSPEGSGTLLVAVTGWGAQADRARSKDAGFAYHLTKPIDYSTLVTLLSTASRSGVNAP